MSSEPQRKRSINIRDARIAGLYDLEHTIGQGHFAVVKLARHVFTGEKVACKIIDKANLDPQSATHIMQEVRCMKLVQHPNIVRLYEVIDTQTKLFLCLELGDFDMHDFIVRHEKGVAENLAQQYFCQIITAIDYCHRLHVVHRDLKPENVVFFEKLGMVKLTDFGFSNLYEPGQQLSTSCGSLAYSAPEILLGDAYDAPAVDVWSLGVILYMLVCGRLPFQETNDSETLTRILDCRYTLPETLSTPCKNLIQRMLVRDPTKRAILPEIVANPWVVAGDRGHASALPLIVQHHLPHSAHTTIIEQMVAGQIGTEDAIISALENDEYSSLTATYYLLAERILSSCREEKAKEIMAKEAEAVPEEEPLDGTDSRSSRASVVGGARCRSRSNSWRARPCTILKEESEEELSSYLRSASRQSSRNSSPSVSMFGGSARDRVSPQTVTDLLEFSRLGNTRRAASPDSVRSSRSPSPPASSSGRASPSMSTLSSFSRLKVASTSVGGGMRKLSSSPHLLGICEEGEEGGDQTAAVAALLEDPFSEGGQARANRSASTGLVHGSRHGCVQVTKSTPPQANTYSAVRMIRPRHAVVSPDVCRRYEQHQRFVTKSRRSTSCSSSEASDDERLSIIGSKCGRGLDGDEKKEDDDKGNGGCSSGNCGRSRPVFTVSGKNSSEKSHPGTSGSTGNTGSGDGGGKTQERRVGSVDGISPVQQLLPILEMPQLDSDKGERIRARIMHRSHTAERILRDWAGMVPSGDSVADEVSRRDECWLGTPPREGGGVPGQVGGARCQAEVGGVTEENPRKWIRRLRRTRSHEEQGTPRLPLLDVSPCDDSHGSDQLFEFWDTTSSDEEIIVRDSDSGCSSRENLEKKDKESCPKKQVYLDPHLIYSQPRDEKVAGWLHSLQFSV